MVPLDISTPQKPVLPLDVLDLSQSSGLRRPMLHLDVSALQQPIMPLGLSFQQQPLLLLTLSILNKTLLPKMCLFYSSLCSLCMYLFYSTSLSCLWMCMSISSLCCLCTYLFYRSTLQQTVQPLDVYVQQKPMLPLHVSVLQQYITVDCAASGYVCSPAANAASARICST